VWGISAGPRPFRGWLASRLQVPVWKKCPICVHKKYCVYVESIFCLAATAVDKQIIHMWSRHPLLAIILLHAKINNLLVKESFSYDRQAVKNMVRKAWLVLVRIYLYCVVLALPKCVLLIDFVTSTRGLDRPPEPVSERGVMTTLTRL